MVAKNETVPETTEKDFVIVRVFDAPRETVFKAWVDPKQMTRWWGPRGLSTPVCEMDVRAGGAYRIVMRSPEGIDYPITGHFREVTAPARLVMTQDLSEHPGEWMERVKPARLKSKTNPDGVLFVTVTFEDVGGRTKLTVRTQFTSDEVRDAMVGMGMTEGWGSSLDRLAEQVGAGDREIVISRVVDAPRGLVWDAMTKAEHVVNWWGPRGFSTTIKEMDVRVGGVWSHVMRGPDGAEYPNKSVFREVIRPERIVYAHGGAKRGEKGVHFMSTWTFDEAPGGRTIVTIRQVYDKAEDREFTVKTYGAIEGGKQTLARLGEEMAKVPVVMERTFGAPVEKVWHAITELDEMKQWYFPQLEAFKAEVGFETQFNISFGDKNYLHVWKVTEVEAGEKITYSWKFGGYPGESFLTFELSPVKVGAREGTKLTLTHRGLETFEPERNAMLGRGNFVMGWSHFMNDALAGFLEKGASGGAVGGEKTGGAKTSGDFVITRVLDAPRERVWAVWTEAEHLAKWFGPKGWKIRVAKMDLRAGGMFHYCMAMADGHQMWGKWVFREIDEPRRIVLVNSFSDEKGGITRHPGSATWPREMLSTTTFEEEGGKTRITLRWAALNATPEEQKTFDDGHASMTMGWGGTFEQLEAYLAQG